MTVKVNGTSAGTVAGYLYVLRVPLIIWLALLALPWLALPEHASLGSLFRGLFDIVDPEQRLKFPPFTFVTLAALMTAATIGLTVRLVLWDGAARFGLQPARRTRGLELAIRLACVLVPISIVGGVCVLSLSVAGWPNALGGTLAGAAIFYVLMRYAHPWLWNQVFASPDYVPLEAKQGVSRLFAVAVFAVAQIGIWLFRLFRRFVQLSPAGFIDDQSRRIRGRHVFALFQFFFSLVLYGGIFLLKKNWYWLNGVKNVLSFGQPPQVPTLSLVLVLAMLVCWGLAALTFSLDRYRVPLVAPLVIYSVLVGVFPQGDHFFQSIRHTTMPPPAALTAAQLLATRAGRPTIVVAATGGGIQAGAWTARVLAGLHHSLTRCGDDVDGSIVLVSAVSGGSVGAMYFADEYAGGHVDANRATPDLDSDFAVKAAEASSLDEVAWGLAYPDLTWTLFPYFKGVWIGWPPHIVNGDNLVSDRGYALENTWKRSPSLAAATLDSWRADVANATRERPAVIFNATIAETGDRLLLGTTALLSDARTYGRRDFSDPRLYGDSDISITTAARLSATFPFVSPPARILRHGVFRNEYHIVDGGYYDNYGTATLIEWLDQGLRDPGAAKPSAVLVLQIRSSAPPAAPDPDNTGGSLFETTQPLTTMLAVRGTGQLSHSDVDTKLVTTEAYGVPVSQYVITFDEAESDDSPDIEPPLSWHLTPADRARLRDVWREKRQDRVAVHRFLTGGKTSDACVQ